MKAKWMLIAMLALLFQGPMERPALSSEKEPVDLIFEEILAMYQDLDVDKFFKLEGVQRSYPKSMSFKPGKADFFDKMNQQYQFSTRELEMLKSNGFFVRDPQWYGGFGIFYYNIYASDLPVMVTTDSLLHALHKSYDDILKELEVTYLRPGIGRVAEATRQQILAWSKETDDKALAASLKDADAYLTVALSLLEDKAVASLLDNDATVARILEDVKSLRMLVPGQDPPVELFGEKRWVDFSQFKPRGHYTDSVPLSNYFRCMMWLGRADTGLNIFASERQLRTAVTLVLAMEQAAEMKTLEEMDEIISFMVGSSDNLTPFGLRKLLGELEIGAPEEVTTRNLAELTTALKEGRGGSQMIRSQMVVSWPDDQVKVSPPSLFQLFGQRYIIDSFVLSKVVFDSITYKGRKQERFMPSPLDVMAALGNREALSLLKEELTTWHYSANLKAAIDFVASHQPSFWEQNLYNIWLDTLRTLDKPLKGKFVPQAMQTRAWQRKQLNTQLASWAQLRHDTILYAKQSYTAAAGCVYPKAFVEPYPEFYRKMGFFAERAGKLLGEASFIDESGRARYGNFFTNMAKTMQKLEKLADKELAARPFSKAENKWLSELIRRRDGHGYGATPVYNGWYVDLFYGGQDAAIEWDPEVADVHTDPNSRQVLQVGVGRVNLLFAAIDSEDDLSMYLGPTLSYHQFNQPASNRLTDPEWQEMIQRGDAPAKPTWTDLFLTEAR